jgi:ABC-type branched-subunit amino acid transport system substrate-binding protein
MGITHQPIMKHLLVYGWLSLLAMLHGNTLQAQDSAIAIPTITVFAPVYIDSAFSDGVYKLGNGGMPRQMWSSLEFYQGMMLAVDSLNKEKVKLRVIFQDTKSMQPTLEEALTGDTLKQSKLMVAVFTARNDIKPLADFSKEKKIPLLSYTFPNDGGVTQNPYFVLINPTLKVHLEAIFKYLQRNYPTQPINLFKRKGATEDMIQQTLEELNKKTPGTKLKLNPIELRDGFMPEEVLVSLDSTKENITLCGSLQDEFAFNLTRTLGTAKLYRSVIIGMPTWETGRDYSKFMEIIYTSHFQLKKNEKAVNYISTAYKNKLAGKAGDMVFKGFEAMYHFGKLLAKYPNNILQHLSDKEFRLLNDFDIRANKLLDGSVEYLENKKVYFIRKQDGLIKTVKE